MCSSGSIECVIVVVEMNEVQDEDACCSERMHVAARSVTCGHVAFMTTLDECGDMCEERRRVGKIEHGQKEHKRRSLWLIYHHCLPWQSQ